MQRGTLLLKVAMLSCTVFLLGRIFLKEFKMFERKPSSPSEFRDIILFEAIKGLKLNLFHDNFDTVRFNFDGVDRSNQFDVGERVRWFSWFQENVENLFKTYQLLNGEICKLRYLTIIAYRLAGHHSMRIKTSYDTSPEAYSNYLQLEAGSPSALDTKGMFGSLKHLDFEFKGKRYVADCLGLEYCLFRGQYFFDEEGVRLQVEENDHVVDAGACLGDASLVFAKAVGPDGRVYAFDPVEDHLEVVRHNAAQNPDCSIQAMPYGLSDRDMDCPTMRLGNYAPGFNSANAPVPLRSLDSLVAQGEIPKLDFIKMDIEGAELAALKGAMAAIKIFRPKLAISLYHKPNDLFEIPSFINANFPFYQIFLGHYTIHNEETVLYCKPIS
jgi:FkbM family methyltransferase